MFIIVLSLLTVSLAQQGLDLIAINSPCQIMASYTSQSKCYARKCAGSVLISDDINFNGGDLVPVDSVDDFAFLPVNNCTFQAENKIFTYSSYGGIEDITIELRGQQLISFDSVNLYYARPNNVQFVSYNRTSIEPVAVKSIDGQRMSFGNWNAICTYDAKNGNKCLLNGITFDMGGMCAHKLLVIGGYAVLTCSKNFPPDTVRKVRIVKISDGTFIGEIGVPWMEGYISSPEQDSVAAIKTKSGIQVQFSVLGVGFMMEVLEQGSMVGYRSTINSFNSCSGTGTAFSNGGQIFVQSQQKLFGAHQSKTLSSDCAKIFEDYSFDQFKQTASCSNPATFRAGKITKTETFDTYVNKLPNCLKYISSETLMVKDIQDMIVSLKSKGPRQKGDREGDGTDSKVNVTEVHVQYNADPNETDLNWGIEQEYPGLNDPWYWYYRDTPLSTTNNEKTADFWIDMGVIEFSLELCFERGMNCTSTCCKQTYCAAIPGDCVHYFHNNYMELYTCVIVILSIVIGIPTCVKSMEFLLIYKFCKVYNEDENAYTGGTTILEGLYKCVSKKAPTEEEGVVEADVDDEYAKKDASKTQPDPKQDESPVKTCCKACLCCITKNTVLKETEMALNSRHSHDDHTASIVETKHSHVQFADLDLKNDVEGDLEANFDGEQGELDDEETEQIQDYYSDDY